MNEQPSTSAGRLHAIVTALKERPAGEASLISWSAVFGVNEDNYIELVPLVYKVGQLIEIVASDIRTHASGDPELYLSWVGQAKHPFEHYTNYKENNQYFTKPFDNQVISLIAICDDQLKQAVREDVLDEEMRQDALRLVKLAVDAVLADESMEHDTREYILKHLHIAELALVEYKIFGIKRAVDGVEDVIAMASLRAKSGFKLEESESGEATISALKKTVFCVNVAQSAQWLLEAGQEVVDWLQ